MLVKGQAMDASAVLPELLGDIYSTKAHTKLFDKEVFETCGEPKS